MITHKQIQAIKFCESLGFPKFTGEYDSLADVTHYLYEYYDDAKALDDEWENQEVIDQY